MFLTYFSEGSEHEESLIVSGFSGTYVNDISCFRIALWTKMASINEKQFKYHIRERKLHMVPTSVNISLLILCKN